MSNPYAVGSVNDSADVPTTVRHRMVLLATVAAILLYLDRICMSTAAFAVAEDLQLAGRTCGEISEPLCRRNSSA